MPVRGGNKKICKIRYVNIAYNIGVHCLKLGD